MAPGHPSIEVDEGPSTAEAPWPATWRSERKRREQWCDEWTSVSALRRDRRGGREPAAECQLPQRSVGPSQQTIRTPSAPGTVGLRRATE